MQWFGKVGFGLTEHNPTTGKSRTVIKEFEYYGTMSKNTRKWESNSTINEDLNIQNILTIYADNYLMSHQDAIKYATFNGVYWKVTNIQVEFPQMILTLGGVYNGVKA